jgi:hypothetical protein
MADTLKGLLGGRWSLFVAWMFPAIVGVFVWYFVGFDAVAGMPFARHFLGLPRTDRYLVLAFFGAGVGVLFSALSLPLYRILEGYLFWPEFVSSWRRNRHVTKKADLWSKYWKRQDEKASPAELSLILERLDVYPADDEFVVATMLGNAMRAIETYAFTRFGMDSQLFWSELFAETNDPLRSEYENARAKTDQFVAWFYVTLVFGVVSVLTGWFGDPGGLRFVLVGVAVLVVGLPLWYLGAARSTGYWRGVVQAIVNTSRAPVAERLGVAIPPDLDDERAMWPSVAEFVKFGYAKEVAEEVAAEVSTLRQRAARRTRTPASPGSFGRAARP